MYEHDKYSHRTRQCKPGPFTLVNHGMGIDPRYIQDIEGNEHEKGIN